MHLYKRFAFLAAKVYNRPTLLLGYNGVQFMSVSLEQVYAVAKSAKLAIKAETAQKLVGDINNLLELVEQMDQVDTQGVEPMAHSLEQSQRLRPDEVTAFNVCDQAMALTAKSEAGLYLVPAAIKSES